MDGSPFSNGSRYLRHPPRQIIYHLQSLHSLETGNDSSANFLNTSEFRISRSEFSFTLPPLYLSNAVNCFLCPFPKLEICRKFYSPQTFPRKEKKEAKSLFFSFRAIQFLSIGTISDPASALIKSRAAIRHRLRIDIFNNDLRKNKLFHVTLPPYS